MRRPLVSALAASLVAGTAAVVVQLGTGTAPAAAAVSDSYSWKNVQIAGGGFVPGIVFNPTERNLVYARTDIGGAYRWNEATSSWIPLLDFVGWDRWGWNGVVSLATDPVQTNRVYVAAGMYTNSWDPNNGAILRSTDKGATWQSTALPFKVGGNMPGRGMGERLAVDPLRNSTVYFGASEGNGLWRSTDFGVTWARVTAFPNAGNWAENPSDPNGYLSHRPGIVWVTFDRRSGNATTGTQTIYVGVADLQNTVYRTTNGGTTWERVAGQPTGFLSHQGELDTVNGFLYITTSDNGGPYAGGHGDVWKYNTATGAWTQISPIPSSNTNDNYFGYAGLTIDRQNPRTVMVTAYSSWWPDTQIFRSTDGGTTWRRFWDMQFPNRTNHYAQDITAAPWLSWGETKSPPEVSPKLGWMTEGLEIDPFNSNRMMYGTGATIYGTTNLTALDTGGNVNVRVMAQGLEETAVLDLVSPPTGAPLLSGLGDIGGFRHTNVDAVPPLMYQSPNMGTTTGLDFAETNPAWMVRVGNVDKAATPNLNRVAFSTDGGANWFQGNEPGGVTGGGTVAASANGSRFVWSPAGAAVHVAAGFGTSWTPSTGIPSGALVESDRVNANKFYGLANGTLYVSTNGGTSFTAAATGLPTTAKVKTVPGREGDIWVAGSTGLFRSTNSGTSFTRVSTVASAINVGYGRAAPGQTFPAVFLVGTVDGVAGVYRSDNAGTSWARINDASRQWGNMGEAITGDPRVYGRVYLGTNGRGILYGDRLGGPTQPPPPPPSSSPPPPPPPPPPSSSAPPPPPPPPPPPTTTAPPPPGNGCAASYAITDQWGGAFRADVTVRNTGTTPTTSWTVTWTFANGQVIQQIWAGLLTQNGANVTVRNEAYNGVLAPNTSTMFGFIASWSNTNALPTVTCTRTT